MWRYSLTRPCAHLHVWHQIQHHHHHLLKRTKPKKTTLTIKEIQDRKKKSKNPLFFMKHNQSGSPPIVITLFSCIRIVYTFFSLSLGLLSSNSFRFHLLWQESVPYFRGTKNKRLFNQSTLLWLKVFCRLFTQVIFVHLLVWVVFIKKKKYNLFVFGK